MGVKITELPYIESTSGVGVVVVDGITYQTPLSSGVDYQPLDSDLTAYADALDATARRALINAEVAGAAAAAQAASQPLDSDLTAYADALDATARCVLIGAVKTTGNETIAGGKTFTNQLSSPGSTSTVSVNNVLNMGANDERYSGRRIRFFLEGDLYGVSLVRANSTQSLILPAGVYQFEGIIFGITTSSTAGFNVGFYPSNPNVDYTSGQLQQVASTDLAGSSSTAVTLTSRLQNNVFQFLSVGFRDGHATTKANTSTFSGHVSFSSQVTITAQSYIRTTTAATTTVNATKYIILTLGTTIFTNFGASSDTVGVLFTASGPCTGTGTVTAATTLAPIPATAITVGKAYAIVTLGSTPYTSIGAMANMVDLTFTATAVGTGTGTVAEITTAPAMKAGSYIIFSRKEGDFNTPIP